MNKGLNVLINLFFNCGYSKEEFNSIKKTAYSTNFGIWKYLLATLSILSLTCMVLIFTTQYVDLSPWFVLFCFVYSLVLAILFFNNTIKPGSTVGELFIYLTICLLMLLGIGIDYRASNMLAVTFVLLLVILPMFVIDRPIYIITLLFISFITYTLLIVLVHKKNSDILIVDLMDVSIAFCIGMIISLYSNHLRVKDFLNSLHVELAQTDIILNQKRELEIKNEELSEALENANNASTAKTTFLFNMSHDIRTPMNAIIGFLDLAVKDINDTEKTLDHLKKSRESSEHLLNLINDILDMSRIESGKMELSETSNDIIEIVNNSLPMMYTLANKKNITLNVNIGDIKYKYLCFDYLRLNQALINIVSNAVKYTNEGGQVDYTIKQSPSSISGYAIMTFVIKDNGIGMSSDFLPHIFEQFSREKSTTVSKRQGTGLGLAITKRIIDIMKGSIDVESELGKGTTFTISIPFKIQSAEKKTSSTNNVESLNSIDLKGKKCLLVEDNELNREISTEILKTMGFEVETAEDGSIAVNCLREKGPHYYDIVLMDIQMPVMDGYEATKHIRTLYPNENIPIIALSANAFEEDKKKSINAGMNDHQSKPIIVSELYESISKLL